MDIAWYFSHLSLLCSLNNHVKDILAFRSAMWSKRFAKNNDSWKHTDVDQNKADGEMMVLLSHLLSEAEQS